MWGGGGGGRAPAAGRRGLFFSSSSRARVEKNAPPRHLPPPAPHLTMFASGARRAAASGEGGWLGGKKKGRRVIGSGGRGEREGRHRQRACSPRRPRPHPRVEFPGRTWSLAACRSVGATAPRARRRRRRRKQCVCADDNSQFIFFDRRTPSKMMVSISVLQRACAATACGRPPACDTGAQGRSKAAKRDRLNSFTALGARSRPRRQFRGRMFTKDGATTPRA